jgi:hypothetical protein
MSGIFSTIGKPCAFVILAVLLLSALPTVPAFANVPVQTSNPDSVQQQFASSSAQTNHHESESSTLAIKYALVVLVVLVIVTTILHAAEKLTIYCDYTDIAVTTASLVIPLVVLLVAGFLEFSSTASGWSTFLVFAVLFGLVVRSTWGHNRNVVYVIMALLTKYSVVAAYLIVMFATTFDGGPKQKHETQEEYEYRIKKTEEFNTALRIAATGIFLFLTHLMTRNREFSSLANYLKLDFHHVDHEPVTSEALKQYGKALR